MRNTDPRVLGTPQLLALIKEGNDLGLNRQLDYYTVERDADPEGIHVLGMVLPFHQAYDAFPPHHRVQVYIKVKDSMEPVVAYLDVTDEKWDRLIRAEDLEAASA